MIVNTLRHELLSLFPTCGKTVDNLATFPQGIYTC
ncbi:hypothetical protein CYB_1541 [Synechococcus sp. JA-2-3B'a(2-13)]|nr:hypothetical protein CYB_1541 [Synechococcus sp. JA-2-3B'a(2-13)]